MACPDCGSGNTLVERRLDGFTECMECGLKLRHAAWQLRRAIRKYNVPEEGTRLNQAQKAATEFFLNEDLGSVEAKFLANFLRNKDYHELREDH